LLFAAYLILFAWLITKVRFFKNSGLSNSQLIILFLLKVMAGILYGWIGVYYGEMAQMIDTWAYHYQGLVEYHLLLSDPVRFFTSLFDNSYPHGYGRFLTSDNSWWNDLKANFYLKIVAILHLFSFGHYYVNVILYSFLSMFGPVAVYRIMRDIFPGRNLVVIAATFLVPSFLYWTSGLHKEGIIFTGLALVVYHIYFGLKEGRFPFYRVACILLGFVLVLALRNFLIVILVPTLFAWILATRLKFSPILTYIGVMFLFGIFFFSARYLVPQLDFPQAVVTKQQEFLGLGGNSAVAVRTLEPSFSSFIRNVPQALSLSAMRPYPSDVRHLLSLAAAIEINLLLVLFIVFVFFHRKTADPSPFMLFCLFFSFATLMMIGYSVNVLGAIVRYRSVVFPFLLVPMAAMIDWNRLNRVIIGNINQ
jgi:hypothetical protein